MTDLPVIIAGGGIGGLATALTLHQIGVPCVVLESVREMRPLGVGINLQPNAVRELYDLGLGADDLDRIGVPAREWALVGLNGREIYAEPRGLDAGYNWPQYAVHRGLGPADALAGLTSVPAKLLGLDNQIGTLAVGKEADLVVLSGLPFAPSTRVLAVMIDGQWVYQEEDAR